MSRASRPPLSSVILTSAAINPGNSGGALVAEAPGIGFAIDSNTVLQVADTLVHSRVMATNPIVQ
jgi:S1-C subfamily serine protease